MTSGNTLHNFKEYSRKTLLILEQNPGEKRKKQNKKQLHPKKDGLQSICLIPAFDIQEVIQFPEKARYCTRLNLSENKRDSRKE